MLLCVHREREREGVFALIAHSEHSVGIRVLLTQCSDVLAMHCSSLAGTRIVAATVDRRQYNHAYVYLHMIHVSALLTCDSNCSQQA
jgi:hypothetical protein